MKNSEKKRRSHIFEKIKIGIIAALVICLIVLVVVYIGGTRVYERAASRDNIGDSIEKLWSVQGTEEQFGLDGKNLTPEFIGYKLSDVAMPLGTVGDEVALREMYSLIKPCVLELFGKDSVVRTLTKTEGEKQILEAQSSDEFVYIRYHEPVLYQLIYAYAEDSLTVSESDVASGASSNVSGYIKDMVIIPDEDYAAHRFVAYATDSRGNYFEFRPDNHFVASKFYISELAQDGEASNVYSFDFVKLPGSGIPEPMVDAEIVTPALSYESVLATDEAYREDILKLFGYNLDKLNFYNDNEEIVYVDLGSRLRIGDGAISFVAVDDAERGIEIGSLLGYMGGESYSLFDKLTAVDSLIRKLKKISPTFLGGDEAEICLGDVYTEGSLLVIEYFLTYDSVRVSGEPVLRVHLTENTLRQIEIILTDVRASTYETYNPKPAYVLRKLGELNKYPDGKRPALVSLRYSGGEASWTVFLAE